MNASNAEWPWYRLTERGRAAVASGAPQPYDPDGFIGFFDKKNPAADHVLRDYVIEAVKAFNVGCLKASAVMLGCASEKCILLLLDAFAGAITDPAKRAKFERDAGGNNPGLRRTPRRLTLPRRQQHQPRCCRVDVLPFIGPILS